MGVVGGLVVVVVVCLFLVMQFGPSRIIGSLHFSRNLRHSESSEGSSEH